MSSVIEENGKYYLYASNDSLKDVPIKATARILDLESKQIIDSYETELVCKAYSPYKIELPWTNDNSKFVVCDILFDDGNDRCFYKKGDLKLKPCDELIEMTCDNNSVTVKAKGYIHAVEIKGECIFSDNYFSLFEGEERTITFENVAENKEISVNAYTI